MIPGWAVPRGNPFKGPDGRIGKTIGMMQGMSSDAEDDLFSSDEEGEHNVENFMLCSLAHHACSPLL